MRIPFSRSRAKGRYLGPRAAYPAFIFAKPGAISLSLSLSLSFQSARDYRYRLPPPLTSRTTVLRNAGNWRSRERREGREGGRKKRKEERKNETFYRRGGGREEEEEEEEEGGGGVL